MRKLSDVIENRTAKHKAIMVTGCYQAGKSRFIASFSGKEPEEVQLTPYSRYETYREEGNLLHLHEVLDDNPSENVTAAALPDEGCLYLLEWKGARTWDNLLLDTGDFIQGYIMVLDSTKPDTFRQAKAIVETLNVFSEMFPHVIAANRPDAPGAWTLEDMRIAMRLEEIRLTRKLDEPIVLMACDAADRQSTMDVVAKLAERMPDRAFASLLRQHLAT